MVDDDPELGEPRRQRRDVDQVTRKHGRDLKHHLALGQQPQALGDGVTA